MKKKTDSEHLGSGTLFIKSEGLRAKFICNAQTYEELS
jgi:hypothetical protein